MKYVHNAVWIFARCFAHSIPLQMDYGLAIITYFEHIVPSNSNEMSADTHCDCEKWFERGASECV